MFPLCFFEPIIQSLFTCFDGVLSLINRRVRAPRRRKDALLRRVVEVELAEGSQFIL